MTLKHFIFSFFILVFVSTHAQNIKKNKKEPKVGLVLSGGGAKGFAHIGVLKVIDSLGIKIDYVSGTSMGAIIGSLYASGYSGKQLEDIFNTIDFNEIINDEFPRDTQSFYERENAEKYAVNLPFDKFKISLPSALSRGQNVYNLLYQLMLPVNDITDFSKLPIPFFCIATNIETGKAIIMDKGRLAEAVTASGALPSLFQPVQINDIIHIDGGIVNNFPVEELRAKGMDIIIGVDVQDDLRDRTALKTAPDILVQINNFRTIDAMRNKAPLTDIYIKPDITNFSVLSFNEGEDIIANGQKAALAKIKELINTKAQQSITTKRPKIKLTDSLKITTVSIKGNKRYTRSYILGKLKLNNFKEQKTIAYNTFKKGINNLISTNNFETFRYDLKQNKTDSLSYSLVGTIKESEGSTFLRLGLHYDGLYKSAALANITQKRLLFKNDIASLDVILGDNSRYNFDYFIDKGYYISIGFKSRFNQFDKSINPQIILNNSNDTEFANLNKIGIELTDFTNQLYFQTIFRRDFSLRFGAEYKRLKITSETLTQDNDDEIIIENTGYFSLFSNIKFDSYSNRYFAKKGFYFNGDFNLYLNASNFNEDFKNFSIAKADIGYAFSLSNTLAVRSESQGGFKLGDNSTSTLDFGLGGYAQNLINNYSSFYGYDYLDLSGNSFVKTMLTVDYEIFKKHHILLSANYANIGNNVFDTGEWLTAPDYSGYAIGYSLETFLGPIEGKFTHSPETNKSYWFFNLGFWF